MVTMIMVFIFLGKYNTFGFWLSGAYNVIRLDF